MKSRSRMNIIAYILEAANRDRGITKTKIMYSASLSYAQLQEYVTILTDNDVLRYDGETHTYKTTEKGLRFLQIYNEIKRETTTASVGSERRRGLKAKNGKP